MGQLLILIQNKITGQILFIDKDQENTKQKFINNTFNKKKTNFCNWCINI